jgi:AcrR family transcriptional regulator
MPQRDEQDFENRRQQIIDGALQVFSSKGFDKATNKDIAIASGIGSPGLIYLEQRMPVLQLLTHVYEEMMNKPPQEVLAIFAKSFLRVADNPTSIALMKLLIAEAFRQPQVAQMLNKAGPSRSIEFLTRYLAGQMARGVLKPMDPRAAARCFIGPLVAYLITEVFLQPDARQLDAETMVSTTVEVFLQGMQFPDAIRHASRTGGNLPSN